MAYSTLSEGNERFKKNYVIENKEKLKDLSENGQYPQALFITCSDSRVCPNLLTDTGPGELFVARNIGNFVPPYDPTDAYHATASAIEYAVSALKVPEIVVCGHTQCGAVATLYSEAEGDEFVHVRKWLELGDNVKTKAQSLIAKDATHDELLRLTEKINVLTQMENLLSYPYVKKAVESGTLKICGWIYDLRTGEIEYYDDESKTFVKFEG